MKIREIRAVNVRLPASKPKTPARRESWRQSAPIGLPMNKYPEFPPTVPWKTPGIGGRGLWVQVIAEDGTWGLGRTSFGEPVASLVDYHYAPLLTGRDCLATELLNDLMWRSSKRHGSLGISACAQSAIDLALWDLKGKLLQQPVYRLLGGPFRDRIPCYATGDDLDWSMELGFKAFKITNPVHYDQGIEGLNIMEKKVAWARETVGRGCELMINPVMAYDVEFAIRLAERLRPYELRWMEEPLFPEDLEGHIQLRKAVTWIPIATGEDHHTRSRAGLSSGRRPTLAMRRPPSRITPGPDGARPMSYPRLVQPVLDRHCTRCHDGSSGQGKSVLALTGEPAGRFTRSYESLKPFVRWHEWGGQSISNIVTLPGRQGADESRLAGILDDATHAAALKLPAEDRQRLYIWLDGNVPFYGTYAEDQQQAQLSGKAASPPRLQ